MSLSTQQRQEESEEPPPRVQKFATLTVCMVPPPSSHQVWEQVTKARTELKDPGLFRWPPHVNLLYPFVNIKPQEGDGVVDEEVLARLQKATEQVEPFQVTLDRLGTFGGKTRGVLWLYPSSSRNEGEPVHELNDRLVEAFPECSSSRAFNPHMTISHFESLDGALEAKETVESWWPKQDATFELCEIYLLQRKGDDGQFMRVATLGLGQNASHQVHDPHLAFPDMPTVEEEWVRAERMAMKARRNGGGGGRRGRRKSKSKSPGGGDPRGRSRSTDTPEEIAAKRAARKAKREQLEREKESDQQPRGRSRSTDTPEEIAAKQAARKSKRERLEREKETGQQR